MERIDEAVASIEEMDCMTSLLVQVGGWGWGEEQEIELEQEIE